MTNKEKNKSSKAEMIFTLVVIVSGFAIFIGIEVTTTHMIIPKSLDCDSQFGFYFSNSTQDALYRFHNVCLGFTNQNPGLEYKLKTYNLKNGK